jgi:acetyltransferase-like isoleucine patch superfamily enzyme
MANGSGYTLLEVPREGVNDDVVRVLEWLVAEGHPVETRQPVAVLETTKVTYELEADRAGYLFPLAQAGAEVPVGMPVALIADQPTRPEYQPARAMPEEKGVDGQLVTKKARALIEHHQLALTPFAGLPVVRAEDVEAFLRGQGNREAKQAPRRFRGQELSVETDWDAVRDTELYHQVAGLLTALRQRMKARYNRHVPTGDLLYDRWELAKDYGFGEGTSVYDSCLILGDVKVGRNCWVGPNTILDGQGGLTIGDCVDVGAGVHIYTHNTIERALTGHQAPLFKKATTIGSCCFLAPKATIAPGTVLGDHCFVAVGSYVEGSFPSHSYVAGNPARLAGVVEVEGGRARIRPLSGKSPSRRGRRPSAEQNAKSNGHG